MTHPIAIGRILEVKQPRGVPTKFVVTGYNERDYMMIANVNNQFEGMTIHPAHAQRVADNDEGDSGIKILDCDSLTDITVRTTSDANMPTASIKHTTTNPTASSTPSKKERAKAIKDANPTASRQEIIQMFIDQLDMSKAGASTYYSYK